MSGPLHSCWSWPQIFPQFPESAECSVLLSLLTTAFEIVKCLELKSTTEHEAYFSCNFIVLLCLQIKLFNILFGFSSCSQCKLLPHQKFNSLSVYECVDIDLNDMYLMFPKCWVLNKRLIHGLSHIIFLVTLNTNIFIVQTKDIKMIPKNVYPASSRYGISCM
jgi:hypothetical protein